MPTIFTRIIEGELPAAFVWRDESAVAFLSVNPLRAGHTLVVPVQEADHWIDLDPDDAAHLMKVSQAIARAQQSAYQPAKIGLMIAGLEVPHVHLHVLPIDGVHDLDFGNAGSATAEELEAEAAKIREALREQEAPGVSD